MPDPPEDRPGASTQGEPPQSAVRTTFAADHVVANRYKIVRFVAQGGMGEVYEAVDLELGGRLALKTVRGEVARDPKAVERFKREIQLARRVTSPCVSRVFDLGFHRTGTAEGDVAFLTMELLEGESLAERLRRGRLTPAEALPIVGQVVAGLAAAHEVGVVHRDLKPGNVFLVPFAGGVRAVVTDFGLAHAAAPEEAGSEATSASHIGGTAAYMSPEQVEGFPVRPASDIYALGVVMYEMLTGARPFVAETPLATAVKRVTEPPAPLRSHVPDLPPPWEAVVLRCLERNPAERFARVEDVAVALAGGAVAPAAQARRRRRHVFAAAAAACLLVGVAAWLATGLGRRAPLGEPQGPVAPRRAVAVLGFRNLSAARRRRGSRRRFPRCSATSWLPGRSSA